MSTTLGLDEIIVQSGCETKIEVHKAYYLWKILHYNFHKAKLKKGESLQSSVFHATTEPKCKWCLHLFPNGKESPVKDDSSLYLRLHRTSDCNEAFGEFKFSVLNENQNENVEMLRHSTGVRLFKLIGEKKSRLWGFDDFIKNDYELPSDNSLTIYCEVTFSSVEPSIKTFDQSNSISLQWNVPNLRLCIDLKQLFNTEEFTDVVLTVNDKEFRAHKTILVSRSPVFAAMFRHEGMKETSQNKINITDLDEEVVKEMLNYLYTDRSENLEELAEGLLVAAEKYGLEGLKDMSERVLAQNLSVENAINVLILADLYRAPKLKSRTIGYIVTKSAEVMKTPAWKNIDPTHMHLVIEVCETMSSKLTTSSTS